MRPSWNLNAHERSRTRGPRRHGDAAGKIGKNQIRGAEAESLAAVPKDDPLERFLE